MVYTTRKVRQFVLYAKKKGFVTKSEQPFFVGFQYYLMIWYLRDNGLMVENGTTANNEKMWVLTEKGGKACALFTKMEDIEKKVEELLNEGKSIDI